MNSLLLDSLLGKNEEIARFVDFHFGQFGSCTSPLEFGERLRWLRSLLRYFWHLSSISLFSL